MIESTNGFIPFQACRKASSLVKSPELSKPICVFREILLETARFVSSSAALRVSLRPLRFTRSFNAEDAEIRRGAQQNRVRLRTRKPAKLRRAHLCLRLIGLLDCQSL